MSESDLVGNLEDQFSHDVTRFVIEIHVHTVSDAVTTDQAFTPLYKSPLFSGWCLNVPI